MTKVTLYRCDEPGCTAEVEPPFPLTWVNSRVGNRTGHRCPEHVLQRCKVCGRLGRPQRFTLEQYPGTVRIQQGKGMCATCERGREPVKNVAPQQIKFIKRLIHDRFDDPDDALLVLDTLGLLGSD